MMTLTLSLVLVLALVSSCVVESTSPTESDSHKMLETFPFATASHRTAAVAAIATRGVFRIFLLISRVCCVLLVLVRWCLVCECGECSYVSCAAVSERKDWRLVHSISASCLCECCWYGERCLHVSESYCCYCCCYSNYCWSL